MRKMKSICMTSISIISFILPLLLSSISYAEEDVTDKVQLIQSRMMFDRSNSENYLDVSLKNISDDVLLTPIKVVIDNISDPSVTVANADGVTDDGKPYFEYSGKTEQFLPDTTSESKRWSFYNPNRARFNYTINVVGGIPEAFASVGFGGGVIEVTDPESPLYGFVVEIPDGALTEEKVITITEVENAIPFSRGSSDLCKQIDIGPSGTVFEQPILIKFPYDDSELDENNILDELTLKVSTYDEEYGQWLPVEVVSIDTVNNIIIAKTSHLTIFAVAGDRLIRHGELIEDSTHTPILFVHGIQPILFGDSAYGDIYSTFGDGTDNITMSALNFLYAEGINVYGLEYDTSRPIQECAISLKLAINKVKSQTGSAKVNVIAHSMGGLVTRAYLVNMADADWLGDTLITYEHDIAKLMMVATPNHGSYLSGLSVIAEFLPSIQNYRSTTDLLPPSMFLQELNSRQIDKNYPIVVDNIYGVVESLEGDMSDFWLNWSKVTDGVVKVDSAQITQDQNVDEFRNYHEYLITGYHHLMFTNTIWPNGIAKVSDMFHPVYSLMKSFALDEDNDGVTDVKDLAPNTPENVKVNSNGISFAQMKPELLIPQNGDQGFDKDNLLFKWKPVLDPIGGDVEYCMVITDNEENVFVNMCDQDSFIDETIVSWSDFTPSEEYSWAVWAREKNNDDNWTQASDWLQFTISPDNDFDNHTEAVDCDDTNPDVYPGAMEICENGIDENCSGSDSPETFCVFDTTISYDASNKFVFSSRAVSSETNGLRLNLRLLSASGCWYMVTPNFDELGAIGNAEVYYLPPFGVLNIDDNILIGKDQHYQLDLNRSNVGAMSLTAVDVILRGIFGRKLEDVYTFEPTKEFIGLLIDVANESNLVSDLDTATGYLINREYISAMSGYLTFIKNVADEVGHEVIEQKFIAAFGESGSVIWENGLGTILQIISLPDKYYALKEIADYYIFNPGPFEGFVKIEVSEFCTEIECAEIWYKDYDGDGYSDGQSIVQIEQPDGYYLANELSSISGDLDDNDINTYPGAPELCGDGIDNNCDGEIDEGCGPDLNAGLVAYYPFDGNAIDETGNGNDGIEYGGMSYISGVSGQAASFDGVDDFITVLDSPSLRLSNTDFTLSTWVYEKNRNPSYSDAILYKRGNGSLNGWIFSITGEINVVAPDGRVLYRVSSGTDPYATSQQGISLNNWHHVTLIYKNVSETIEIYIDGVFDSIATNIPSPNPQTANDLYIGKDSSDMYDYYFDGFIDDTRIYNRALSEEEIEELYTSSMGPAPINIFASYDNTNEWNWITWREVPGAVSYNLYWGTESGVTKDSEYAGNTSDTEFSHTGVVPDWTYYYRVSSVDADGNESELSEEVSVYVPIDLNDGLVAYYPFNGNANDESGNGNDGTEYGGVSYVNGVNDQAASFDGVDDHIVIQDTQTLRLNDTNFTISLWVNETKYNTSNADSLLAKRDKGIQNGWFCMIGGETYDDYGKFTYYQSVGPDDPEITSNGIIALNTWHHILLKYNKYNEAVSLYIDGFLEGEISNFPSTNPDTTSDLFIGMDSAENLIGGYFFTGLLDEIKIYNRDLSYNEIQELYIQGTSIDIDADGYSHAEGDFDDNDPTIYPGAVEIPYDGIDQDCNGIDLTDVDGDGYDGYQVGGPDLDDDNAEINPSATEICGDGIDNNCDGEIDEGCGSDLDAGLVAYYPFNGNANDESGNGNNGEVSGAVLTVDRFGDSSSAYAFDGIKDFINFGNSTDFNFTDSCTFSLWINPDKVQAGRILNKWVNGQEDKQIFYLSERRLRFYLHCCSDTVLPSNSTIDLNKWTHIILVYDGNEQKIYIDGIEDASNERVGNIANSIGNLYAGYNPDRSSEGEYPFSGKIDDIRIYNRALSEAEIQELYRSSIGSSPINLSASYENTNEWNWITWDPVSMALSYNLYWGTESGVTKDSEYAGNTSNTEFSHTGVIPGWTYYYRVSSIDADNSESELSEEVSVYVSIEQDTFTNSLGMTFNQIPAGTFMMGSPEGELGRYDNETQHQVTLTNNYFIQTTEVTQGQWRAVVGNNPSYFLSCGDDCPIEWVTWNDIQNFITELNKLEEGIYRLPTEAEWEYAARAGNTRAFANGEIMDPYGYDPNLDAIGWYALNSDGQTHPVAQKKPNTWGLYDMHGNVWEWVQDWYDVYTSEAVSDPTGPISGSMRVVRGGAFGGSPGVCRSAVHSSLSPDYRNDFIGFRLVLSEIPADTDDDGITDEIDNCQNDFNPDQLDSDGDGVGDVCDDDSANTHIITTTIQGGENCVEVNPLGVVNVNDGEDYTIQLEYNCTNSYYFLVDIVVNGGSPDWDSIDYNSSEDGQYDYITFINITDDMDIEFIYGYVYPM